MIASPELLHGVTRLLARVFLTFCNLISQAKSPSIFFLAFVSQPLLPWRGRRADGAQDEPVLRCIAVSTHSFAPRSQRIVCRSFLGNADREAWKRALG